MLLYFNTGFILPRLNTYMATKHFEVFLFIRQFYFFDDRYSFNAITTLGSALKHVTQLTGITPQDAYCDMGYRGHGLKGDTKIHLVGKISKRATKSLRKWMKRRAAVEPIIGHLKSDYRLNRNYLKGQAGDRANVVLAAAAYNMAKLLAWFYCAAFLRQKLEAFIGKIAINLCDERKLVA